MATPYRGFEVIFTQKEGDRESIQVTEFFTDEILFLERKEESFIEVKENRGLSLTFHSDSDESRLFMDGLDSLPLRGLERDQQNGEVYLSPNEKPVTLFDHTNNDYPLIPGIYQMRIIHHEKSYYAWVKVVPKQLDEAQWEQMKDELEQELEGLAKNHILKKSGLSTTMQGVSLSLLEQFFVINNRFSSVMAALTDLYRKVNYSIQKDYPSGSSRGLGVGYERQIGNESNRGYAFKTSSQSITYDLPENRLTKKIIESISKTLKEFIAEIEEIHKSRGTTVHLGIFPNGEIVSELGRLKGIAEKMKGAIQWIKTAPWYESVGGYRDSGIPFVMNSDSRYRALYQIYRELNNEKSKEQVQRSYSTQWKRSDKLYEIWGFVQMMKALTGDLGFTPVKGWIYNDDYKKSVYSSELAANTEVLFKRENISILLKYDALLPTQSRLTTVQNPLYTRGTHTRPDGRMDVYDNEIYIGSIIMDFKYRPRISIWNESLIYQSQLNEVMKQLVSYGDNVYSSYLFGANESPMIHRISPIHGVWAIYPKRSGIQSTHEFPDHKVSLIELTPGKDNGNFVGKIKYTLNQLIESGNHFRGMFINKHEGCSFASFEAVDSNSISMRWSKE
jgi:hypothetical protein